MECCANCKELLRWKQNDEFYCKKNGHKIFNVYKDGKFCGYYQEKNNESSTGHA
jgi:hypothetical protein